MKYYEKVLENLIEEKDIKSLIENEPEEPFFLDYKQTQKSDYSKENVIKGSDLKNITKAISGFGNSEGGMLIFGIAENEHNQKILKPFKGYEKFSELVHEVVSRTTNPTHNGIYTKKIKSDDGLGYVIINIPQSGNRPLQAILDQKTASYRYLYRSGDSFVDMPHDVIIGLLGKEKPIELTYVFTYDQNQSTQNKVVVDIMIINKSASIAKNIWFTFNRGNFGNIELSTERLTGYSFRGNTFGGYHIDMIADDTFKVPPGGISPSFSFFIINDNNNINPAKNYSISFSLGCDGSKIYEFKSEFKGSDLITHINEKGFNKDIIDFLKSNNIKQDI